MAAPVRLKLRPFYQLAEEFPYLMYFDLDTQRYGLWWRLPDHRRLLKA
jgi:hypothetical protein